MSEEAVQLPDFEKAVLKELVLEHRTRETNEG